MFSKFIAIDFEEKFLFDIANYILHRVGNTHSKPQETLEFQNIEQKEPLISYSPGVV